MLGPRITATPAAAKLLALALFALISGACRSGVVDGGFEDDGTGATGLPPPDLPRPECDPRRSDDCDEGFKCSYLVDPEIGPTNRCVPLVGDGQVGDPCEAVGDSDTCGNHLLCWGWEPDGNLGLCFEFCNAALTCSEPGMVCSVSTDALLPLCLHRCDPLIQDCLPTWGCYPDPGKRWSCDRDHSGPGGGHGDPCECLNCCDPGFICVAGTLVDAEGCGIDGAIGCCTEVCQLPDLKAGEEPPICPGEFEGCAPFYTGNSTLGGYERVGYCRK
ncbi:MAG: hypothetical protein KC457_27080 [Myxococcales bacterium]|nr:hypothetical protein [Myxococcales bacterium]